MKRDAFRWGVRVLARGAEGGGDENEKGDDALKPLVKTIVESAMAIYDNRHSGRLSFDEWSFYAKSDRSVGSLVRAMGASTIVA